MSLKTYRALSGQSLYDLAIVIYKDVRGIAPIMQYNDLDVNAVDYTGTDITYEDTIVYKKLALAVSPPAAPPSSVVALDHQSIYDAACSIYGDIRKLALIVAQVPTPDNNVSRGTLLTVEKTDHPLAGRYQIATS